MEEFGQSDSLIRLIARVLAKKAIKKYGPGVNPTTVAVTVGREIEKLAEDGELLVTMTNAYVQTAEVHVGFQDHRITEDGNVVSEQEARDRAMSLDAMQVRW